MIVLLSSSKSRAKILQDANIDFVKYNFDFKEDINKGLLAPNEYVDAVVKAKLDQAGQEGLIKNLLQKYADVTIVMADSCVFAGGMILGKAKDKEQAKEMLLLQSGSIASVFTAMRAINDKFMIGSVSRSDFYFDDYDKDELGHYLDSGLWQGKAGAMMIEGFSGQFVRHMSGSLQNAMGLDVDILKAFL